MSWAHSIGLVTALAGSEICGPRDAHIQFDDKGIPQACALKNRASSD